MGVTVNGDDIAFGPTGGDGWNYNADTHILTLSGDGPFTHRVATQKVRFA